MPLPSRRDSARARPGGPFAILVVCTGNICRSPLGAAALRRDLADLGGDVVVTSAGVRGLAGAPADPQSAEQASRLGLDLSSHQGRWLEERDVAASDLILALDRGHRSHIVETSPEAIGRSFTLLEFAAIASVLGPDPAQKAPTERLRRWVRDAARARGQVMAGRGQDSDIEDPYGQPAAVHRRVADQIATATEVISTAMLVAVGR